MKIPAQTKAILTDIEGTTSSISFVKDVLFPYAFEQIPSYLRQHEAELTGLLADIRQEMDAPNASLADITQALLGWIRQDLKITPLKELQGLVWEAGYRGGTLKGHLYPDAYEGLKRWQQAGYKLYVYSSGSIKAQQLLFAHTTVGDLTPLFSGYFDTTTGPKKDAASYKAIAEQLAMPAEQVLFLSDVGSELEAAQQAGMRVILLDRDQAQADANWPRVSSFEQIRP